MAREERRKGRRAWVRYARIWVEGKWWRWDEERQILMDGKGEEWGKGREGEEARTGKGEEKKREVGGERRQDRKEEGIKIGFWNVVGVLGKDEVFWKRTKEWDVMGLVETWLEEKDWEKVKGRVPEGYSWRMQGARRESKRGRAIGGILMGVREGLEGEKEWWEEEGLMVREVRWKGENWMIGTVYIRSGIGGIIRKLAEKKEERGEVKGWVVGGDFNARIGERGGLEEGEEGSGRRSKDKRINRQGKELVRWVGEEGWGIMNGAKEGDKEGEMTFVVERGELVIDYVLGDGAAWERGERMEVGEEVESDHQALTVWMGRGREEEE
ncbi:hypothetical protein X777_00143, partial [Ooceraea biroi]